MKKLIWKVKNSQRCKWLGCDNNAKFLLIDKYVPKTQWLINYYCSHSCIREYLKFKEVPDPRTRPEYIKELTQNTRFLKNRFLIIEIDKFQPWQFEGSR